MQCEVCGKETERTLDVSEPQYGQEPELRPLCSEECDREFYRVWAECNYWDDVKELVKALTR